MLGVGNIGLAHQFFRFALGNLEVFGRLLCLGLPVPHLRIQAVSGQQLVVCSLLMDGSVFQDQDLISVRDGGQPVSSRSC